MKLIATEDYEEMSDIPSYHIIGYITQNRRVNLAITAGRTPSKMYDHCIPPIGGKPCYSHVHYYNFEEITFMGERRGGVTISHLRNLFLTPAGIKKSNIHKLTSHNFSEFYSQLQQDGGLDLIVMGLGGDAHFCGNMPGQTRFHYRTVKIPIEGKVVSFIANTEMGGDFFIRAGRLCNNGTDECDGS